MATLKSKMKTDKEEGSISSISNSRKSEKSVKQTTSEFINRDKMKEIQKKKEKMFDPVDLIFK